MKKIILLSALLLGIVSCSACGKKGPDPIVVDAQPPLDASVDASVLVNPLTVKGARWEFNLPNDSWMPVTQDVPVGTVLFVNAPIKGVIIIEEKEFPGTLDVLAVNNLRAIRDSGATIVSAKQTDINGHKFVLVEATKNNMRVWAWMTTNGTYAHAFSCGGNDTVAASMQQICFSAANTLQIK